LSIDSNDGATANTVTDKIGEGRKRKLFTFFNDKEMSPNGGSSEKTKEVTPNDDAAEASTSGV
jgi:hypothetical protein